LHPTGRTAGAEVHPCQRDSPDQLQHRHAQQQADVQAVPPRPGEPDPRRRAAGLPRDAGHAHPVRRTRGHLSRGVLPGLRRVPVRHRPGLPRRCGRTAEVLRGQEMTIAQQDDNDVIEGRITDEDIERAKAQIGIPVHQRDEPWNRLPNSDAISHFAWGCGDDNPLFHDPAYGADTRWHSQIAPPTFPIATGLDQTPKFTDPEGEKLFRGLCRGSGKYYAGVKWTWYQPVYPGRPVLMEAYTKDVEVKESSRFAGGRSVKETFRYLYVDANGNPIATRDESYINVERHGSKKSGKLTGIERKRWTPEELEEVERAYEAEVRRGADPRWWEDVKVGDELPAVMKGPLTTVDIISMHMGWGWGGYG